MKKALLIRVLPMLSKKEHKNIEALLLIQGFYCVALTLTDFHEVMVFARGDEDCSFCSDRPIACQE